MCYLTGLVYEELFGDYRREKHLQARLAWLRRQPAYTSQPYEQLARFYRNSGHLRHASDVGFAREEQRLRKLREDDSKERRSRKDRWKTRWSLLLGSLLRWVVGFGYRPYRAIWFLLGLLLLRLIPLVVAEHSKSVIPSKASEDTEVIQAQLRATATTAAQGAQTVAAQPAQPVEAPLPRTDHCDESYPCFSTLLFTVETVVPLINLRQAEYWTVEAEEPPWRVLRWWLGVSSILGWVLVTVTASTVLAARR
jgi:hypothetical protein